MLSSLRTLWFEPRRSSVRIWMFRIHQWAGVGAGLYLAMMGLTGSLSVFLPELRNTLVAHAHASAGQPRLGLQTLQTAIERDNPVLKFRAVYPGRTASEPDIFEETGADEAIRQIVLDPYTGNTLASRRKDATFYDWARDLHANLLNGKTGKTINGFGGLLLLLTGAAGIVIWWPGRHQVKTRTFQVSARKGWHRLSYDLHRLGGVLVCVPLAFAVLTGIGLAFPQVEGNVASALLGPRSKPLRSMRETPAPGQSINRKSAGVQKAVSLDDVVRVAAAQVPGATPIRIQAPNGKTSGFLVWMRLPRDWRDEGDNRVLVDSSTAQPVGVQIGKDLTLSSRFIQGATAVHYGQYGGLITRVLGVMVGITLPLFYVSGIVLWWRRVARLRSQRLNRTGGTAAATAAVYAIET